MEANSTQICVKIKKKTANKRPEKAVAFLGYPFINQLHKAVYIRIPSNLVNINTLNQFAKKIRKNYDFHSTFRAVSAERIFLVFVRTLTG